MFLEGDQFSGPQYEVPVWLRHYPPWVYGIFVLVAALVAAVIPEETVEAIAEFFLSGRRLRGSPYWGGGVPCAKCGEIPPKHGIGCENAPR